MNLIVHKTLTLYGHVKPPSSKSQTVRGLLFALLAKGQSTLKNVLNAGDTQHAIGVCKALGATITAQDDGLIIQSPGLPLVTCNSSIYTGNSGITTRFIMPILGLRQNAHEAIILDCGEQMRARPIGTLVDALKNLGLTIQYLGENGSCPIAVSGTLMGGQAEVEGLSSQYLSALLMALPCVEKDSEVIVKDLHERPYVAMTLNWLKQQNIQYTHHASKQTDTFSIQGKQHYHPFCTTISGDFSSASYLIAASALLKGRVALTGLDMQDPQGDKRLVDLLQEMGADITIESERLIIQGGKPLTGISIDANDIPDLLPTLAVLATQASGKTNIYHVPQARIKETDRIHAMTEGLTRMGAKVEEHADGITVYPSQLHGAKVNGYDDHRTVMALSLAGMLAEEPTVISDAEAINKTFPNFITCMQSLGANMKLANDTYTRLTSM